MSYSKDVAAAEALARAAHAGQEDKAGQPYILHPQRVAARLSSPETQVVAWLHDTVEDTDVTLAQIAEQFAPRPPRRWNLSPTGREKATPTTCSG